MANSWRGKRACFQHQIGTWPAALSAAPRLVVPLALDSRTSCWAHTLIMPLVKKRRHKLPQKKGLLLSLGLFFNIAKPVPLISVCPVTIAAEAMFAAIKFSSSGLRGLCDAASGS